MMRIVRLGDFSEIKERDRIVLLVPGENVVSITVTIPPKLYGKDLKQVIDLALEDYVSEPAEEIHAVTLRARGSEEVTLLLTRKKTMQGWLDAVAATKGICTAVVPDYLALPWSPRTWSLWFQQERLIVRSGVWEGWSAETEFSVACLLRRLEKDKLLPTRVLASGELPVDLQQKFRQKNIQVEQRTFTDSLNHIPLDRVNLLTSVFSPHRHLWREIRQWSWVGGVLLAVILLSTFDRFLELQELKRRSDWYQQASEILYRQELKQSGPILDLRQQVERLTRSLEAQEPTLSFVEIIQKVTPALTQAQVTRIEYDSPNLTLEFTASNFSLLERITESLERNDLRILSNSSESEGQRVAAVLIVSPRR